MRVFEVRAEAAGWVVRDSIGLYATRHRTRDEAICAGQLIAERSKPCRLIVKAPDGTVAYDVTLNAGESISVASLNVGTAID